MHVVRCFDGTDIVHVEGAVDPIRDIETIDTELILSDLEVVSNRAAKFAKAAKTGDKKAGASAAWLEQLEAHLGEGKNARTFPIDESDEDQVLQMKEMGLLTAKPVIYAANMSEDDLMEGMEANQHYQAVKALAATEGAECIPICAKTEEDIADYTPEEKKEFLAEMGIAWTIRKGTKAPQAAGKIHSDFERGFIRASVVSYDDFAACDYNMANVKAKGLQRTEGKEYVVQDGDIIEFLFNV